MNVPSIVAEAINDGLKCFVGFVALYVLTEAIEEKLISADCIIWNAKQVFLVSNMPIRKWKKLFFDADGNQINFAPSNGLLHFTFKVEPNSLLIVDN